eukprot:GILK01004468.1.p1 GENE.GILK01004468.1~~GILK01004468.1.p1  ORF type:complete len:1127 (+),score=216.09 GILK01004468.1:56-3436(+)
MAKAENITVFVRVRPPIDSERGKAEVVVVSQDRQTLRIHDGEHDLESRYDCVLDQSATQAEVYNNVRSAIPAVLEGYNCTIFAYGQTGSGKTFTMFGPGWDQPESLSQSEHSFFEQQRESWSGIIPRTIRDLFAGVRRLNVDGNKFTVYCSFLEIYNEKLYDLLQDSERQRPLSIHEHKQAGIFVEGLTEYVVQTVDDCITLLKRGNSNRAVRATYMNPESSRSHTIFQLLVENERPSADGLMKRAKLNLCDLAGSEKWNMQHDMVNAHLAEMKTINLSLTTLGKCISALTPSHKSVQVAHVPYRESKLTRLLQDSLGGNTRTWLLATVSPVHECVDESISTLKFADRAKRVMVRIKANEIQVADDETVKRLQREIAHLRDLLKLRKTKPDDIGTKYMALREENHRLKSTLGHGSVHSPDEVEKLLYENRLLRLELQKVKDVPMLGASMAQSALAIEVGGSGMHAGLGALLPGMGYAAHLRHPPYSPDNISSSPSTASSYPGQNAVGTFSRLGTETSIISSAYGGAITDRSLISSYSSHAVNTSLSGGGNRGREDSQRHSTNWSTQSSTSPTRAHPIARTGSRVSKSEDFSQFANLKGEALAQKLEEFRFKDLENAAQDLRKDLVKTGRCPVCTLRVPCKHYSTEEALAAATAGPQSPSLSVPGSTSPCNSDSMAGSAAELTQLRSVALPALRAPANRSTMELPSVLDVGSLSLNSAARTDLHLTPNSRSYSERSSMLSARNASSQPSAHHSHSEENGSDLDRHSQQSDQSTDAPPKGRSRPPGPSDRGDLMRRLTADPSFSSASASSSADKVPPRRTISQPPSKRQLSVLIHRPNSRPDSLSPDKAVLRVRGRYLDETVRGSIHQTLQEDKNEEERRKELKRSKERMKTLQKLEEFREARLRKELERLEEEKRKQQEERAKLEEQERRRLKHIETQKKKLEQQKQEREKTEAEKSAELEAEKSRLKQEEADKKRYHEEQKRKLAEYHTKKQQSSIEDEFDPEDMPPAVPASGHETSRSTKQSTAGSSRKSQTRHKTKSELEAELDLYSASSDKSLNWVVEAKQLGDIYGLSEDQFSSMAKETARKKHLPLPTLSTVAEPTVTDNRTSSRSGARTDGTDSDVLEDS